MTTEQITPTQQAIIATLTLLGWEVYVPNTTTYRWWTLVNTAVRDRHERLVTIEVPSYSMRAMLCTLSERVLRMQYDRIALDEVPLAKLRALYGCVMSGAIDESDKV